MSIAIKPDERLLDFGSDLYLRNRWFLPESMGHPAKLHLGLLQWIVDRYTKPGETVADPMAGIGSVLYAATLQRNVIASEIEPQWLEIAHRNAAYILAISGLFVGEMTIGQHDARQSWNYHADHIIFSPPYANAAGTTPNQRKVLPYRISQVDITLGERWQQFHAKPTPGAMGAVNFFYGSHPAQVGHLRRERYWQAMTDVYRNAYAALTGGYLILVVKDHIKDGQRAPTAEQTIHLCQDIGFILIDHHQRFLSNLSLWQRRRKERGEPVVEEEDVLVFKKLN